MLADEASALSNKKSMLLTCLLIICSVGATMGHTVRRPIKYEFWTIEPWGESKRISINNNAPPNLRHTIYIKSISTQYPNFKTVVLILCKKISLPPKVNGDCESGFTVYDGEEIHKYCGERENIKIITENDKIILLFTAGHSGGGVVDCVVQGEFKNSGISISVRSEPVDPGRFPNPNIFPKNSVEIDSLEYGGLPGAKKTTCDCGWTNKGRIVGRELACENEFPWMAALIERNTGKQICGASIVSAYHAVTAAHCTYVTQISFIGLDVVVGANDLKDLEGSDRAQTINVARIIQHNKFKLEIAEQDISLLVLEKRIKFSQEIGRVCLPKERINLNNQYVKVMGWGKLRSDDGSASILKKLDVMVVPIETCATRWAQLKVKDSNQLCTYAYQKASCSGDSGGPLVWVDPETKRYTLVGIVSYGNSWCGNMYPAVNTEVAAFTDWLNTNIKESMPNAEICTKK